MKRFWSLEPFGATTYLTGVGSFNPQIEEKFYQLYKNNNLINTFENPLNYKILDNFTEDEKYLILSEGRPVRMQWIILLPK